MASSAVQELLDPGVWRAILQRYAAATRLAVALTDASGRMLGDCINARPLWSLLRARAPVKAGNCPFCIRPVSFDEPGHRVARGESRLLAGGYAGLVHFSVPLKLAGDEIGFLLAGQVQNKYPEQLQLQEVATDLGLAVPLVLETARSETPMSDKTLYIYWDLLESFAEAFLNMHLHRLMEKQRLSELAEIDRRKDEFLATLSHELRTPLTAIVGWVQILKSGRVDSGTLQTALEVIERNAHAQTRLVEDLLELSGAITGKIQLDVQRTDLVSVINAAVNSVRPSAEIKNVAIQVALDTSARFVMGDFARLQQVVWNLLTNSVKFTPPQGRIEVRLEQVASSARIVVSDTGEGIKKEFLSSMFDRFTQADSSRKRQHGGLGLGLSIVRELVQLHGGSVEAYSAGQSRGAIMVVTLPLAPAEEALDTTGDGSGTMQSAAEVDLKGLRILVVDDEKDARELLKQALAQKGAMTVLSDSVESALSALRQQQFDAVISDIAMPFADGYDFIAALRRLPEDRGGSTPAIALTAFAHPDHRRRLLASGFQAYISKPFCMTDVFAAVAAVVSQARRRAS